ncbi:hypothetical protein OH491_13695 [Termitidicoccus mucosus]|uniref:hypothetical protein n=1 Tax=Termitidicoccus mucosus TaxID=1184151 RepID=UPI0026A89E58
MSADLRRHPVAGLRVIASRRRLSAEARAVLVIGAATLAALAAIATAAALLAP